MSSLVVKLEEGEGADVELSDVVCPICLRLYLQPVKMPCRHVLCLSCFNNNVAQATLSCPLCRTRISSWCRKAVKDNTLVDQKLWNFIKMSFPHHVESRQAGLDEVDAEEVFPCVPVHQFAAVGDIKTEFDSEREKAEEEERLRRERDEELGSELAEKMDAEERQRQREAEQQESSDLQFARRMWKEMTATPASSKKRKHSVLDLLKKSAEKKSKISETEVKSPVEEPKRLLSPEPRNSDVEINFSDETFLKEQKMIESKLEQERKDMELARKLHSEDSQDNNSKEIKTPTLSKTPNSKVKSCQRQLSLLAFSSKTTKVAENCRLETFAAPELKDGKDKEAPEPRDSKDKENNIGDDDNIGQSKVLHLLKQKIENDLSTEVVLQTNNRGLSDQESQDAELARKLQKEMNNELSSPLKTEQSDGRAVRNVFQVLSESQKTMGKFESHHKHRRLPCRTCSNCLRPNCGSCTSCRDMPQFGGKGVSRQSCIHRKCLKPK